MNSVIHLNILNRQSHFVYNATQEHISVTCLAFLLYRYDTGKDKFIDFEELKHMMEKLGAPQTHLCLKEMIKEVDEDFDGKISFREVWTNNVLCVFMSALVGMYVTVM